MSLLWQNCWGTVRSAAEVTVYSDVRPVAGMMALLAKARIESREQLNSLRKCGFDFEKCAGAVFLSTSVGGVRPVCPVSFGHLAERCGR
jgi:hypothetical protein